MQNEKKTLKTNLHPNNLHKNGYNLGLLCQSNPDLSKYVHTNKFGKETINFFDPEAVKALNKGLLKLHYGIQNWDIPNGYLCPPVPGRADYIHHIADLLATDKKTEPSRRILDIGVGANCIYPIIGHSVYGWNFVGTDIDKTAIDNARSIVFTNESLKKSIQCRLQENEKSIFKGIINNKDYFDAVICNPPFHSSKQEAFKSANRKLRNLKGESKPETKLNFGGQSNELWCEGGEVTFICKMIRESETIKDQVNWFTVLVSKKESLPQIYRALKAAPIKKQKTIDMAQGQKISRIVAWKYE